MLKTISKIINKPYFYKENCIILDKKTNALFEKKKLMILNNTNCPVCKGMGYYIENNFINNKIVQKDCYLCNKIIN